MRGLCILLLLASYYSATAGGGSIIGKVTDARTKEPLAAVSIRIENTQLGVATNSQGEYVLLDLSSGIYGLRASFVGYRAEVRTGIRLREGDTAVVNFSLEAGEITMDVVEGYAPVIDPGRTTPRTTLNKESIASLPLRNGATPPRGFRA